MLPMPFICILPGRWSRAVAELLYGSSNPSGRLPVSMPRHVGQIPVCYNYRTSVAPAYCDMTSQPLHTFGEGRSYTTFTGSDVSVTKEENGISVPLPWKIPKYGRNFRSVPVCAETFRRRCGKNQRAESLYENCTCTGREKRSCVPSYKRGAEFCPDSGKPEVICMSTS